MVRAAGWLLVAALAAGCATDNSVGGTSQIGKVQGLYVEQYNGVFVDRQVASNAEGKPLWVYVTFDHPLADGRTFATATLPADPGVEPGDLVQLRFAVDNALEAGSVPEHNQVTAIIAKRDTAQARAFGSSQAKALDILRQAAADARP
jgi:hypothetical protein